MRHSLASAALRQPLVPRAIGVVSCVVALSIWAGLSGCGSGSHTVTVTTPTPTPTPTPTTAAVVSIAPTAVTLYTSVTQTFTASIANATSQSVTWSVEEGSTGGTITSAGVYTAPTTAGTYHVVATSVADSTKTATVTVTVQTAPASVSVAVSPVTATLSIGASLTLSATVNASTNQSVTWSVQEGSTGGSVTSGGVYTAPSAPGTYHVVATSAADSTATGVSTITVQSGSSAVTVN